MSALLSPVQDGKIWREKIVWPNRAVHHFGKFPSERGAIDWINAHPNLTKPEDTIDEPQSTFSLIGQGHCVEVAARSCVTFLKGCVVTGRVNWTRISSRKRMRRQGVEDIRGKTPLLDQPPKQRRRKLSKAELREQAAAAFLAWREGQTAKDK